MSAAREPDTDIPAPLATRLSEQLHRQPSMLPRGCRILVALSGGPDSTALVHLLAEFREEFDWDVQAAHFDHGLRQGSEREAGLLRQRMTAIGIQLHVGRSGTPLPAAHAQLRSARYGWLETVADRIGADRIATAHHEDDQAETVLFRILRGTGNRGLAGIPDRRGRIVRPLLGFSAADLRYWVSDRGLPTFDDPSNHDVRWARSRLRHRLLPALDGQELGTRQRLLSIRRAADQAAAAMERFAASVVTEAEVGIGEYDRDQLISWPVELRTGILLHLGRTRGVGLTRRAAIGAARDLPGLSSGRRIDLGGGLCIERSFDRLVVHAGRPIPETGTELVIRGAGEGGSNLQIGSREYTVRWGSNAGSGGTRRVALSLRRGHYPLKVRSWEAGDRIRLPCGTRKLKRVFGDARVPVAVRHSIPVVADSAGRILWVAGLARSSEPAMAEDTELVIEIEDA